MRSLALSSLSIAAALCFAPRATVAAEPAAGTNAIDHVLLWGRDIDQTTGILAAKLGFQVRPGRNPGGVPNRYVRMTDRSYIELLAIARPDADMDPGMKADQASLKGGPGVRTFGLRSSALEQARDFLKAQGYAATDIFSASPNDPDGAGPSHSPRWRLFAFEKPPLSSHLFYIDYAPDLVPRIGPDEHPNGAREVSAIWLLSADAEADRKQLERMGLPGATPVRLLQIGARGFCVPVGGKGLLALQPDGAGVAADALRNGGPQVLGVGVGVADIAAAKKRVERGYESVLTSYRGPLGEAFLAPTQQDLGLLIEFHAMRANGPAKVCGPVPPAG